LFGLRRIIERRTLPSDFKPDFDVQGSIFPIPKSNDITAKLPTMSLIEFGSAIAQKTASIPSAALASGPAA
jgi:hypothetical protein